MTRDPVFRILRASPLLGLLVLAWLVPTPSKAQQASPVLVNQAFDLGGRFEVMLNPMVASVADRYTRHFGLSGGMAYYFHDMIGLEVDAGYAYIAGDKKLLDNVLNSAKAALQNGNIERLPLTDLKYMRWWATGGLVFSPLYGKLNISSELAFNFHFYLTGGGGVAQYYYHSLSYPGADTLLKVENDVGIKPVLYVGGGLRIHFAGSWSVRFEIRDQMLFDEYEAHILKASVREDVVLDDIVHTVMVKLGVCYAF